MAILRPKHILYIATWTLWGLEFIMGSPGTGFRVYHAFLGFGS